MVTSILNLPYYKPKHKRHYSLPCFQYTHYEPHDNIYDGFKESLRKRMMK